MRFFDFPIVRFSIFLALGILSSQWLQWKAWFVISAWCIPLLIISWYLARRNLFQKPYFGIITYFSFFILGAINLELRSPVHQPGHYIHHISEENYQQLFLEILSTQKPDTFNNRFMAEVISVNTQPTHGKILVYIAKDSTGSVPVPGEQYLVLAKPLELKDPLNPGQFNYASYLRSKDVFRQLRLDMGDLIHYRNANRGFITRIQRFRNALLNKLETYEFGEQELSILKALTLGHKNTIDKDLYSSYASAGAIHVLAVSGLHVGIIYFLLNWMFQPLLLLRNGRKVMILLVILSLIFYALITGLSPSVTRAVAMFSFFGMARLLDRPTNSINTLFLSFFFLLLWNPKWLVDVGFQLSYTAVFFILWLHPKISSLYNPKYYADKMLWGTLTVSFCAQLGVAPLSIYYFNQFPGLFLLSNLVVLPFIGLLVGAGLFLLILANFDMVPEWFVFVLNSVVGSLNKFVNWVSRQEQFIFRDLLISELGVITSYILIICLVLLFNKFSLARIRMTLIAVIILICTIFPFGSGQSKERLIVFHKNRNTIIGIQKDRSLLILKQDRSNLGEEYPISSFRNKIRDKYYFEENIPNAFIFNQSLIIVVDSSGIYPDGISADLVILSGSPQIHLDLLIDTLAPEMIVADGSNYPWLVKQWRASCINRKLPFHHTGESGAFILE